MSDETRIEIEIPMATEGVTCGFDLTWAVFEVGKEEPQWTAGWWFQVAADDDATRGSDGSFSSRLRAAEAAIFGLLECSKHETASPGIDCDLRLFRTAMMKGEIQELAKDYQPDPAPETDTLPPVDSPLSVEDELADLREFQVETAELATAIRYAADLVDTKKAELKTAKDRLDIAQKSLNVRVYDQQGSGHDMPLFANNAPGDATDAPEAEEAAEPWRDVTTEDMGLPAGIFEKLATAHIHTAGDIANWTVEMGNRGLSNPMCEVKGIGPAAATNIDDAMIIVMQAYPPANEGPLREGE